MSDTETDWEYLAAWIGDPALTTVDIELLTLEVDTSADRMPTAMARFTFHWPGDSYATWLNPVHPAGRTFYVSVQQGISTMTVNMMLRSISVDQLTGIATGTACSWEIVLEERLRLSGTAIDTAQTTLAGLVQWVVNDCAAAVPGLSTTISNLVLMPATALPAGVRRQIQPGQFYMAVLEPELQAIGARIRGTLNGPLLYEGASPVSIEAQIINVPAEVISATERVDRDQWANGAMLKYDSLVGTTRTIEFVTPTAGGAHARGVLVTEQRPKPAANAADALRNRMLQRGYAWTIQTPFNIAAARNDVDLVRAGATINMRTVSTVHRFPDAITTRELVQRGS